MRERLQQCRLPQLTAVSSGADIKFTRSFSKQLFVNQTESLFLEIEEFFLYLKFAPHAVIASTVLYESLDQIQNMTYMTCCNLDNSS